MLAWPVYHVENFLLVAKYLRAAIERVAPQVPLKEEAAIHSALKSIAGSDIDGLVLEKLQKLINDRLIQSIKVKGDPLAEPVAALLPSIESSIERFREAEAEVADKKWLNEQASRIEAGLRGTLADGTWLDHFPGRPILKGFVNTHLAGRSHTTDS